MTPRRQRKLAVSHSFKVLTHKRSRFFRGVAIACDGTIDRTASPSMIECRELCLRFNHGHAHSIDRFCTL